MQVPPVAALMEATEAAQVDPEVVSIDEESKEAMRLAVKDGKSRSDAAPRPVMRYQLPAAALRSPFVAALQVQRPFFSVMMA